MHIPVLQKEVVKYLDPKPNENFIDCTVGEGGHASAILEKNGPKGKVLGIDRDPGQIKNLKFKIKNWEKRIIPICDDYVNLGEIVRKNKFGPVNGILFDLGISSWHLEESGRGFSFQKDEPLLMTFKKTPEPSDLTAKKIVNEWEEENIAQIIESYGEERYARKIAHAIVFFRSKGEIKTTRELVKIIEEAVPKTYLHKRIHPATKTFQALRIAVNDEIESLRDGLRKGFEHLTTRGRMAVISFHSIEDRIVKNFFRERAKGGIARLITKKPITPTQGELTENPRSRSAKLRVIEKLA